MKRLVLVAALIANSAVAADQFEWTLPEGNYRVTLNFSDSAEAMKATVFSESRRLMLLPVSTPAAKVRTFIVNIRMPALVAPPENAPGASEVRLYTRERSTRTWDDKLSIEVRGTTLAKERIVVSRVDVPTIYLLGDSTVTDQSEESIAGWGQMLPHFFRDDIAVANHAESGETLKSFLAELRLEKILSTLRSGDWVLIQFGHNDQKTQWPQTYAAADSLYRQYLHVYIAEVHRRGATPILVTSPERRNFDKRGKIVPSLAEYANAMKVVAKETKVALIDLNAKSIRDYETLGEERAARTFAFGGQDRTHSNELGAFELAKRVVEGIRESDPALATHLLSDTATWP